MIAGFLACTAPFLISTPSQSETFHKEATFEISGSGARNWRRCLVTFFPSMTLGDTAAPRLQMSTSGLDKLSIGVENPVRFQDLEFVHNNVRRSFSYTSDATADQVKASEIWKAMRSQALFHVTGKSSEGGKYVSSRYDGINMEVVLLKLEEHCPFDAEALMADVSRRERAEQALSLSPTDIKFLRWALGKRYGGLTSDPGYRSALGADDRAFLKRYYAEHNLPVSQYLTGPTYRVLRSEGVRAEELARPRWIAVAAALWRVSGNVRVAVGFSGVRDTAKEATDSALQQCKSAGGTNCEIKGSTPINSGCKYITLGSNTKGAGWYSRETADEALEACKAAGYNCQKPIGGCVN